MQRTIDVTLYVKLHREDIRKIWSMNTGEKYRIIDGSAIAEKLPDETVEFEIEKRDYELET